MYGASGGAGILSLVLCYLHDQNNMHMLNNIINEIISMSQKNLKMHEQVKEYTNTLLKYITVEKYEKHIHNINTCNISVTDISKLIPRNVIKSHFTSYNQFIETLCASACIPLVLDDSIRKIDGKYYIDGGLSNNMPTLNKNTIKISCIVYPFMNAHVYPKELSKLYHTVNAPDEIYIRKLYEQGYNDFKEYMTHHEKKHVNVLINDELMDKIDDIIKVI
jgi:hypothetical protein